MLSRPDSHKPASTKAGAIQFVAIDHATRWVYINLYADQTDSSSVDFLAKVQQACPVKIIKLLTDNGSQFTDRFTAGDKNIGRPAPMFASISRVLNSIYVLEKILQRISNSGY